MDIRIAKNVGFCFGVKNAVDMAKSLAARFGDIYTYGELIHNEEVCAELESMGIRTVHSLDEVKEGDVLLIRAHGVPTAVFESCKARGIRVYDATCAFVKRIHETVAEKCKTRSIIIIGKKDHPETIGIAGNCTGAYIVGDEADLDGIDYAQKLCVVAQTTCLHEKFIRLSEIIKARCADVEIYDTTCHTTRDRQEEANRLSAECDTMLVFGSGTSSNTAKLAEICRANCPHTYCITRCTPDEVKKCRLKGRIGVVGGASVPEEKIREALTDCIPE